MTEPKFDKSSTVQIGRIFLFSEGSLTAIANGGSFEVNAAILSTAMPRQRIGTVEVLSDRPSAVVSGVEHGAASASVGISSRRLLPATSCRPPRRRQMSMTHSPSTDIAQGNRLDATDLSLIESRKGRK
ncbi:hypothetical protein [Variovorax paradoxus]|uniref:Uncharacterized protein n=1 Tax=Variovorax paradoxus TaxID=34073 RepID=A0A6I6HGE6_VARPD|nr:hypothetical protein [Variovorax paradoxus]QGW81898.1 hypothetical protein GOQ09_09980 [Variovorax paradoxus]